MKININGKSILFLGIGSVGSCCVKYIGEFFEGFEYRNITLIDKNPNVKLIECVKQCLEKGANFMNIELNRENFPKLLKDDLKFKEGDIVIDLTTQTRSLSFLKYCILAGIHYFNSALSEDYIQPLSNIHIQHMYIKGLNSQYNIKATCVVETGMNPGLISSFAKKGVRSIVKKVLTKYQETKKDTSLYKDLLKGFTNNDYPLMAKTIGLRLLICSEKDTQVATNPPHVPFCNTWSNIGLIEETLEPFQVGFGTHDDSIPFTNHDAMMFLSPNLFVAENVVGGNIKIASIYVDSLDANGKPVFESGYGRCISHGENVSLVRYFSGYNYAPTTYFSYKVNPVSDDVLESNNEATLVSIMTNPNLVTMNQTHNVTGYDNVGALLVYEDQFDQNKIKSWWCGTILNVDYVKNELKDNYFLPTTIQVMAGVFSSVSYAISNPNKGILFCEELDDKYILEKTKKYLGVIYNGKTGIEMKIKLNDVILNKTGLTPINLI